VSAQSLEPVIQQPTHFTTRAMSSQDTGPSLAGSAAKPAESAMEEKRYAPDGEAYTEEEFKQFYRWKHPAVWDRSLFLVEPAGTQAASPGSAAVIDPQPLHAKRPVLQSLKHSNNNTSNGLLETCRPKIRRPCI